MKALRQRQMERCSGFGVIRDSENNLDYNVDCSSSIESMGAKQPSSKKKKKKKKSSQSSKWKKGKKTSPDKEPAAVKKPKASPRAVAMPVPGPPGKPLHKAIMNIGKGAENCAWASPSSKSASSLYQIKEGEHESVSSSSEEDTRGAVSSTGTRLRRQSSGCDTVQTPMSESEGPATCESSEMSKGSVDFELESSRRFYESRFGKLKSLGEADVWSKLHHLQALKEEGFIQDDEYEKRRVQLVDELTGTRGIRRSPSPGVDIPPRYVGPVGRAPLRRQKKSKHGSSSSGGKKKVKFHGSNKRPAAPPPCNSSTSGASSNPSPPPLPAVPSDWHPPKMLVSVSPNPSENSNIALSSDGGRSADVESDGSKVGVASPPKLKKKEKKSKKKKSASLPTPAPSKALVHRRSSRAPPKTRARSFSPIIVPRPPPLFTGVPPEFAIKHHFDLRTRKWSTRRIQVRLDDTPFAKGGLRRVYHLKEESSGPDGENLVAKMAIDPDEDLETYFRDVEMQAHCAYYAKLFNSYKPPRAVEFCKAWILELVERKDRPLCGVERFIAGPYRKHNNNFGYVGEDERNTPQAFSHFTYEASCHSMLVVDIQGVGDKYTDPQIHTINGTDFGKGNLGKKGFAKFLSTHRCNSICRYLKLPPVNPKYKYGEDRGTIPHVKMMNHRRIQAEKFDESHCFENVPQLQKYLVQKKLRAAGLRNKAGQKVCRPVGSTMDDEACQLGCSIL